MTDTLLRQWAMLRRIPRQPRKITAQELAKHLSAEGYAVTPRSVQRDLTTLGTLFMLACDDRSKPHGWSWAKEAVFGISGMAPSTALAFVMAQRFLKPLLPQAALGGLAPHFRQAQEWLGQTPRSPYTRWPEKVRVLPRGLKLLPPEVDHEVLDTVYQALLEERRFTVDYKPREAIKASRYEVSPLGLVVRDGVLYLVCTLWDYTDLKQLVLHRMKQAELLEIQVNRPESFNLDDYLRSGAFSAPNTAETLKLEAVFDSGCALHLREARLSKDQKLEDRPDGRVRLTATVPDTGELRWWLLGFGEGVEVVGPEELRAEFRTTAQALAKRYP